MAEEKPLFKTLQGFEDRLTFLENWNLRLMNALSSENALRVDYNLDYRTYCEQQAKEPDTTK